MSDSDINKLAISLAEIKAMLAPLCKELAEHREIIFGVHGRPGLTMRFDRLEQSESRRSWHIRTIWTALLGSMFTVATAIYHWLTDGK